MFNFGIVSVRAARIGVIVEGVLWWIRVGTRRADILDNSGNALRRIW